MKTTILATALMLAAIDAGLQEQGTLDGATVLQLLDAAGIGLVEATGTVSLPLADAKHLHDSMTINSGHDSALWYRLRDLITAAGKPKGGKS